MHHQTVVLFGPKPTAFVLCGRFQWVYQKNDVHLRQYSLMFGIQRRKSAFEFCVNTNLGIFLHWCTFLSFFFFTSHAFKMFILFCPKSATNHWFQSIVFAVFVHASFSDLGANVPLEQSSRPARRLSSSLRAYGPGVRLQTQV